MKLNYLYSLFVIVISQSSSIGQTSSMQLSLGTSFTNQQFIFNSEPVFQQWEPWMTNYPSIDVNLKYSLGLRDKIALVFGVAYNRYSVRYDNPNYIDAFGFRRDNRPVHSVRNYALPQIGISYQTNQKMKWSFFSEAALNVALPFSCYDEKDFENYGLQKKELYREDEFIVGVMVGPSLNAGMVLRPWKSGNTKNLSFTLSVNARLLFFNQSEFNPKYAIGPNLGISYLL